MREDEAIRANPAAESKRAAAERDGDNARLPQISLREFEISPHDWELSYAHGLD
jgi:hypothetical protein